MNLLESVTQVFNLNHLDYAVFGGAAIKVFNSQRVADDIDVIVFSATLPLIANALDLEVIKDEFGQNKILGPGFEIFGDLMIKHPTGVSTFRLDDLMTTRRLKVRLGSFFFGYYHMKTTSY